MRTETTRSSLMQMGKYGFSTGAGDEALLLLPWRNLMLGENSLMTSGHTRSFSRKLNSWCCTQRHGENTRLESGPKADRSFPLVYLPSVVCFHRDVWGLPAGKLQESHLKLIPAAPGRTSGSSRSFLLTSRGRRRSPADTNPAQRHMYNSKTSQYILYYF